MDRRPPVTATCPNMGARGRGIPMVPHILAGSSQWSLLSFMVAAAMPQGAERQRPTRQSRDQTAIERSFEPCLDNNRAVCIRTRRNNAVGKPHNVEPYGHRLGKNHKHGDNGPHGEHGKNLDPKSERRRMGVLKPSWSPLQGNLHQAEKAPYDSLGQNDCSDGTPAWEIRGGLGLEEVAIKVKSRSWRDRVKRNFIQKFYAPSTTAAKKSKRKRVTEILGCDDQMTAPLTGETITLLGAVLDESGIKAADQYIHEAKLMHVEAGHPWTDLLEAKLKQCKRALKRGRGPEDRAMEARPQDIGAGSWERRLSGAGNVARAAWSYVWACLWMLRSVEAVEVKAKHVKIAAGGESVSLFIPKSKMDQEEKGTTRTLGCCGRQNCSRFCPVLLARRALGDLAEAAGDCQLFPSEKRSNVSKAQMIKSWRTAVNPGISGHSARRSGAMMYTREGMAIQEISFLGRWKSSAVFRYMEEALELVAVNKRDGKMVTSSAEADHTEPAQQKATAIPPEDPPKEDTFRVYKRKSSEDTAEEDLWILSKTRGNSVAHHIGKASWNIPLDEWSTRCGWAFARKNVKVSITKWKPKEGQECKKCLELKILRDGVKGARELAHEMCWPEARMKERKVK